VYPDGTSLITKRLDNSVVRPGKRNEMLAQQSVKGKDRQMRVRPISSTICRWAGSLQSVRSEVGKRGGNDSSGGKTSGRLRQTRRRRGGGGKGRVQREKVGTAARAGGDPPDQATIRRGEKREGGELPSEDLFLGGRKRGMCKNAKGGSRERRNSQALKYTQCAGETR